MFFFDFPFTNIKIKKTMLKSSYKRIWVPVMGRLLSIFVPLIEGKVAKKKPTYDIDNENQ